MEEKLEKQFYSGQVFQQVLVLLKQTLSKVANHIAKKKQSGVVSLIGVENLDPILEKVEIMMCGVCRQLINFIKKMEFIMQSNLRINQILGLKSVLMF